MKSCGMPTQINVEPIWLALYLLHRGEIFRRDEHTEP